MKETIPKPFLNLEADSKTEEMPKQEQKTGKRQNIYNPFTEKRIIMQEWIKKNSLKIGKNILKIDPVYVFLIWGIIILFILFLNLTGVI